MSLVNFASNIVDESEFAALFVGCENLRDASLFYLPATTIEVNCYRAMFSGCTGLEKGPKELPATTAKDCAYYEMFTDCSKLKVAPEIKATSIREMACQYMFRGCSVLSSITVSFTS